MLEFEITGTKLFVKPKSLNLAKSWRLDQLHPKVFRRMLNDIKQLLMMIYKQSFESGKFPQICKSAIEIPILKVGKRELVGNHRPITLISVYGKMF